MEVKTSTALLGVAGIGMGLYGFYRLVKSASPNHEKDPFWDNVIRTDNPRYHITLDQTFEGGEFYDDCPGAMVGWTIWGIHSAALRKQDIRVGDVIRVYRRVGTQWLIDKHAVVTALTGQRTIEVNRQLWAGTEYEKKPELRMELDVFTSPQTTTDGRLFHVKVQHIGQVKDMSIIHLER